MGTFVVKVIAVLILPLITRRMAQKLLLVALRQFIFCGYVPRFDCCSLGLVSLVYYINYATRNATTVCENPCTFRWLK